MIDSLAQTYHWPLSECLKLTMAQVILLTHASQVNRKRLEVKMAKDRRNSTNMQDAMQAQLNDSDQTFNGKALSELTSEEYVQYMSSHDA